MAVDERKRHEMYLSLEQALGREAADTLMQLVPPVGWADVATKQDLEAFGHRLDAKLQAGLNSQTKIVVITMVGTMIGAIIAVAVLAFGAAGLTS